jgi:hypothetical protein
MIELYTSNLVSGVSEGERPHRGLDRSPAQPEVASGWSVIENQKMQRTPAGTKSPYAASM